MRAWWVPLVAAALAIGVTAIDAHTAPNSHSRRLMGATGGGGSGTPVNTALPVISPTGPIVGIPETTTTGSWTNSPTSYTCQWQYGGGANIMGATSCSGYTPITADIGQTLQVAVTAYNASGASLPAASAQTAAVAATQTAFYVAAAGNDTNPGTSAQPWQTITRVNCGLLGGASCNAMAFPANTVINFNGGDTFAGCLLMKGYDGGSYGPAIGNADQGTFVVQSYGTGKATITSAVGCEGSFTANVVFDGVNGGTFSNIIMVAANAVDAPPGNYQMRPTSANVAQFSPDGNFTWGEEFQVLASGTITGGNFWKASADATASRTIFLWCVSGACGTAGTVLASCTTSEASGTLHQEGCNFGTAYTITPTDTYMIGYNSPNVGFTNCNACGLPQPNPFSDLGGFDATALSTFPTNSGGKYTVSPLVTTTTTSTNPIASLTPIGVLVTNNQCGVTASGPVTITGADISNYYDTNLSQFQQAEIFYAGLSIPLSCAGPLKGITVSNSTLHGANGVGSGDVAGVIGYGSGLNVSNVSFIGDTVYNLGGNSTSSEAIGLEHDGVTGGVSRYNLVHDLGWNAVGCGPAGIETFTASGITIQFNEVYNVQPSNLTKSCDFAGIDLDGGTSNSIAQYNYTHHNQGPGYEVYMSTPAPWGNNEYSFNISENDNFSNISGGSLITSFTNPPGTMRWLNNTLYMNEFTNEEYCFNVSATGPFPAGSAFENNICYINNTSGPAGMVTTNPLASGINFSNNDYYAVNGSPRWRVYNPANTYTTLASWQAGAPNGDAGSTTADPNLTNPGNGGTCSWTPSLNNGPQPCPSAYLLQ